MQIIQKRKIFYLLSLLIIIPGIISLFMQGLNLGIDFKGGSLIHLQINETVTSPELHEVLNEIKLEKGAEIQKSGAEFFVRTQELSQEQTNELLALLQQKYPEVELLSAESVGATIGSELTKNAFLSVLLASILMLVYITFRFEFSFGVAAIIAVLHDVIMVLSIFSFFQWEVGSAFIAALLTVVGYSINDTIVIFDRVRERLRNNKRENHIDLLNTSIKQTLSRSINTVLTSMLPLLTLFLWGGDSIKVFVLAMLIGFVSGAYSSIFIASPIWYEIKNTSFRRRPSKK